MKAEQKVSVMAERDSANHETRGYNSAVANTQAVGSIPRLPTHSDTTVHNSICALTVCLSVLLQWQTGPVLNSM